MIVAKEAVDLEFKEKLIIGFSVDYGFTNGSFGNLEWELEGDVDNYLDIAYHIKNGKTECDSGSWNLSTKRYKGLDI